MNKPKLRDFAENKYSQFGEDGIIKKVFEIIGTQSKLCIEFGAWDGYHLSNTAQLWTNGWKAVLIEAEADRTETLKETVKQFDCLALNYFVGFDHKKDSLEYILRKHNVSFDVDLISIDIDGNDYYVFESLEKLRPRVVICEFNPTIPYYLDVYAKPDNFFGASLASIIRVANTKGYKLVALTDVNAFFVLESLFDAFSAYETSVEKNVITDHYNHIITNYSGEYLIEGPFVYGMRDQFSNNKLADSGQHRRPKWRSDLILKSKTEETKSANEPKPELLPAERTNIKKRVKNSLKKLTSIFRGTRFFM
ncbi:MAG: hypothetical protein P4L58_01970 [Candidatus Pacebacteria bacterium]|nr:hypothetical protein [Candidatus Paceibacterota bacterium]